MATAKSLHYPAHLLAGFLDAESFLFPVMIRLDDILSCEEYALSMVVCVEVKVYAAVIPQNLIAKICFPFPDSLLPHRSYKVAKIHCG